MEPIEDPVEIRRLIDRVLRRIARRDDYGQLLACGHVVRRIENITDPYLWRSDIRRGAPTSAVKLAPTESRCGRERIGRPCGPCAPMSTVRRRVSREPPTWQS